MAYEHSFAQLRVGDLLHGYCGGNFGDSYADKRVEAIGANWVVAREIESGEVFFCAGPPERLCEFRDGK